MLQFIYFLNILISSAVALDDQRYCYEEQTLERMIRTEHKFEELQKTVATSLQDMTITIQKLQKANDEFIRERSAAFGEEKPTIEKAILELEKRQVPVPRVAFVADSPQVLTLHDKNITTFDYITDIHGGGYDKDTGIFTAPTKGTYIFALNLCYTKQPAFKYRLLVDNNDILRGTTSHEKADSCSSASVFVVLESGQTVWVELEDSLNKILYDQWSYFYGSLLHE